MEANDHPVEEVLSEGRRFKVPLYQRKYQWRDNRLEPFWEDVSAKAIEVLEGESRFEHYMGALILAPVDQKSLIAVTPTVQVVDGQQRLTTFQLFLAALREVSRAHGADDHISHIDGYLFNIPKGKDTDELAKYKLTPTPSDRDLFHDLMDFPFDNIRAKYADCFYHSRIPKNTDWPALRAYWVFYQWIGEFVVNGPDEEQVLDSEEMPILNEEESEEPDSDPEEDVITDRLEALLTSVLARLKLVVITLDEKDDAQVIFETLNSKGEPLLAMDLVRNNIFHRAEKQSAAVENLYTEHWDSMDEPWWREPAPNARPTRPRIDHFLAHVLAAETGNKVSIRELYAEYRAFAVPKSKPRFERVEEELALLKKYVPLYETLEGRQDSVTALSWLGGKLRAWQVTTVYPVAFQVGTADISDDEKQYIAKLLYSYLARRAICGLTAKNLNNVFQSMASDFAKNGVSLQSFQQFFYDRSGDSSRFPDDNELTRGIETANAYAISPKSRLVDILWEFELASRSGLSEIAAKPENLWVEHVMPRAWFEEWPFVDNEGNEIIVDQDMEFTRDEAVDKFGNLTLLSDKLNMSVGKSGFNDKKEKFAQHTGLFLNKWFSDFEKWDEAEIESRSQHMAKLATTIWIGLDL